MTLLRLFLNLALVFGYVAPSLAQPLRVPAFTAYITPNADAARVSARRGITGWNDATQSVNWYGKFEQAGELNAKLELQLPLDVPSKLRLSVDGRAREATAIGQGVETSVTLDFGSFSIKSAGYHQFKLESLNENGVPSGDLQALLLEGPALMGAHFNLKERRNAASVHLMYPVPKDTQIEAFYCEVTAVDDPTTTFYMACGWHRGYFGMQVNSPTERRIIFSVWDSGNEAVDRKKVDQENRVQLMGKGPEVFSGDFGNEGTGGHSHLKFNWRTGQPQRFLVTAQPSGATSTVFSGFWFQPDQQKWMLISSWKAPKEGGWLQRPHSFSENFGGSNGHLKRKALFGNQWIRTASGEWQELTAAKFSHDPTGRSDRLDRYMGIEGGQFFLSHGGFVDGFSVFGEEFTRPATGQIPQPADLPIVEIK